jgi:hypothetical protein
VFDVAQHSAVEIKDYMRLNHDDARVIMSTTILATALELARLHGVRLAASYLCDAGIAIEVAVEVLAHGRRDRPPVHGSEGNSARTQLLADDMHCLAERVRC